MVRKLGRILDRHGLYMGWEVNIRKGGKDKQANRELTRHLLVSRLPSVAQDDAVLDSFELCVSVQTRLRTQPKDH